MKLWSRRQGKHPEPEEVLWERKTRSSVQVNSNCAVVKVRYKECQAESSLDAGGESGWNRRRSCEGSGNRLDKSGRLSERHGS